MEQQRKHTIPTSRCQYIQKSAEKRLKKILKSPEREKQERAFAQAHANDSDEELYSYVKDMKRRLGKRMNPRNTVGYTYIVKRLGPWNALIGKINTELAEEKADRITSDKE